MGSPKQVTDTTEPTAQQLENETFVAFADMDASPTKAYYVAHRHDADMKKFYDMAFALRPGEEFYDLRNDPDQEKNLANDPAFAKQKDEIAAQLMKVLKDHNDPRVSDDVIFEKPPFTDVGGEGGKQKVKAK